MFNRPNLSMSTLKDYMGLHYTGKRYDEIQNDTHQALCALGANWLVRKHKCRAVMIERGGAYSEMPDAIGFSSSDESFLIEAKVSRADFIADRKKPFRVNPEIGMGKYRYFICPKGLISIDELPEKWGLLYVSEKGIIRVVKEAAEQEYSKNAEYSMLVSALACPWKMFQHWDEKALERLYRIGWADKKTEVDMMLFAARLHTNRILDIEERPKP